MKGTPDFPQCGFSANAVAILNYFNVEFKSYNVLENDELRQGIKAIFGLAYYPPNLYQSRIYRRV